MRVHATYEADCQRWKIVCDGETIFVDERAVPVSLIPNYQSLPDGVWTRLKEAAMKPKIVHKPMEPKDITCEAYREYDFNFIQNGKVENRVYRIENPAQLYVGNTTHRVLDQQGVVHCVPAPGHCGCVLKWESKDPNKPVAF